MEEIHIEKARVTDAKQILGIQKKAFITEGDIYNNYKIPPLTQTLAEIESDFQNHIFYIAKLNGEIVGSVNIRIKGVIGFIGRLIVTPTMQGNGIGSMLMDHVEAKHGNLKALELFTGHKSKINLSFYKKRGYLEIKRQTINEQLMFIFMRKVFTNN
jgi:N-acetylglutamate synthase-like GNAT family acetyltransferase